MKAGGRGVLPFVIGLGAAAGGYVVLRRVIPPPPENVTKPEPSSLGGGYAGGAPPGPVADQDPVAGVQAALAGFLEQFGQPTQATSTAPAGPGMVFEDEQPPAASPPQQPAARQPAAPPPRQQTAAQPPPRPAAPPATPYRVAPWAPAWVHRFAGRS